MLPVKEESPDSPQHEMSPQIIFKSKEYARKVWKDGFQSLQALSSIEKQNLSFFYCIIKSKLVNIILN